MIVALDTNAFIDATIPDRPAYEPMQQVLAAARSGQIQLRVSRHTLHELSAKPDAAYELSGDVAVLPHFPVGTWSQQVAKWNELSGTWADAKRNHEIQLELQKLASSGNDIHDRGAYLDAVLAGVDVFVTSDRHLSDGKSATRLQETFGVRIATPAALAAEVSRDPAG